MTARKSDAARLEKERRARMESERVEQELGRIHEQIRGLKIFSPNHKIPKAALAELERDPEKNEALRRLGLKPSKRKK
jgi:hypothetical protein